MDIFQSGFRRNHSTETALIRVINDILMGRDSGKCVALMMLDLSAAFDTVDHGILLARLRDDVGINDVALKWFGSYLRDRKCSVKIGDCLSDTVDVLWGGPSGIYSWTNLVFSVFVASEVYF